MRRTRKEREIIARKRQIAAAAFAPKPQVERMKVYPTSKDALNVAHPDGSKFKERDGSWSAMWVYDGFTCRMLSNNIITTDPDRGL
jgi:hypothetical protein